MIIPTMIRLVKNNHATINIDPIKLAKNKHQTTKRVRIGPQQRQLVKAAPAVVGAKKLAVIGRDAKNERDARKKHPKRRSC